MSPFEVYKIYLALKRHFTTVDYDFLKYNGKIRASIKGFNNRKDKSFFETLSRQKKRKDIIYFFVANFVTLEDPSSMWIGSVGSDVYASWKKKIQSMYYTFEQEIRKISEQHNILDYVRIQGTRHPRILKDYLSGRISLETLLILLTVFGLVDKYDEQLTDPVWTHVSLKIKKYLTFLNFDFLRYESIIRKVFLGL